MRELEGLVSFDVKHFQTIASSALRLEKFKELNTSLLDGRPQIGLNASESCQDLAW